MTSTVTTFRTDRTLQRKIKNLQRAVKPRGFNQRRASQSDVIRTAIETLYAQIAERDQSAGTSEGNHEKALAT